MFKSWILGGALAFGVALSANSATLVNGGFEAGLTGWTATGYVDVVTNADDAVITPPHGEHFLPTEGAQFARLTSGSDAEVFDAYTLLSQDFTIVGQGVLSGDAAFLAFDALPYDDNAMVRVFNATTNQVVFASSVTAVGDYGHTHWTGFQTGLLSAGDYTFEAGVRDGTAAGYPSQLLIDHISVAAGASAAPEPSTWGLMLSGFGLIGAMLRRRRPRRVLTN